MSEIRTSEKIIEQEGERYAISIFSGDGKAYDRMQAETPDILPPRVGTLIYRYLGSVAAISEQQLSLEQEASQLYTAEAETANL